MNMANPYVAGMGLTRLLSGSLEILAALLIWRAGRVDQALQINGLLALVGPLVLTATTALGLAGLAGTISPLKLTIILTGAALIIVGARL